MNNIFTLYRFYAIAGLLLLLFSFFYMPHRIESLLDKGAALVREKEEREADLDFQSMDHDLLRDQMEELNREVRNNSIQINQLIEHTTLLRDSINLLMERAVREPGLLDLIDALYTGGILADESRIDSLNRVFRNTSDELILRIRAFSEKDRDMRTLRAAIRENTRKSRYHLIHRSVSFGILLLSLVAGLIFFTRGIRKWGSGTGLGGDIMEV